MPILCCGTVVWIHIPYRFWLQWIDSFEWEGFVGMTLAVNVEPKPTAAFALSLLAGIFTLVGAFIASTITSLLVPGFPSDLLAAVQQRGPEKTRQHTSARLLHTVDELHRPHPRPHRRIPRIHLQEHHHHQDFQLEPRVHPALITQGGPLSLIQESRTPKSFR